MYLGRLAVEGPASQFDSQTVVEYMTTGSLIRHGNGSGAEAVRSPGASSGSEG
jgi:hypothetical protein